MGLSVSYMQAIFLLKVKINFYLPHLPIGPWAHCSEHLIPFWHFPFRLIDFYLVELHHFPISTVFLRNFLGEKLFQTLDDWGFRFNFETISTTHNDELVENLNTKWREYGISSISPWQLIFTCIFNKIHAKLIL